MQLCDSVAKLEVFAIDLWGKFVSSVFFGGVIALAALRNTRGNCE